MSKTPDGPWSQPPRGEPPKGPKGPLWPWLLAAGLAVGALVLWLAGAFPWALDSEQTQMVLVKRLLLMGLIGASLVLHIRSRPGRALRHAAIWVGIGGVVLLGYSLRHEMADLGDRMLANLVPGRGERGADSVTLFAGRNGHFVADAEVDGVTVHFLVDTGASDVVLSPRDAQRLGFDVSRLRFDKVYNTANGVVRGAPVRLGRVAVGPVAITDVRASVNGAAMETSLLGMSFLGRIGGYEVQGDRLILKR